MPNNTNTTINKMAKNEKQTKLTEFYFSLEVLMLRITGIELIEKNESSLYKSYSAICFLSTTIYLALEVVELKYHSDFNSLGIIIWYLISGILTMSKALVIYINRKEIGNLMLSFHEGFYKPNKISGEEFEERCIYEILNKKRSQMIPYGIFILSSAISGLLASLKTRLTESPENWILPFFPFSVVDVSRSPNFEIAYVYEALVCVLYCTWIYICDVTVIAIMAQAVAQLDILQNRVINYKCRSTEMQIEGGSAAKNLRETIEHHVTLLETIDEVENLSSILVLCVFIANTIMLCLTMYSASLVPIRSMEFVKYLAFSAMVGAQTLMYCWWGNEMTIANERLAMEIYKIYNPDDPTPHAKALKLMLAKAQQPLFFTAGKFVPLSLVTYKELMKGSFSYFTVLRQLNDK